MTKTKRGGLRKATPEILAEIDARLRAGESLQAVQAATGVTATIVWRQARALGLTQRARPLDSREAQVREFTRVRLETKRAAERRSRELRARADAARQRALEELQQDVPGYTGVGHVMPGMRRVPEVPRRSA